VYRIFIIGPQPKRAVGKEKLELKASVKMDLRGMGVII
jgi:hypothetical protein